MNVKLYLFFFNFLIILGLYNSTQAQNYELLLKNGNIKPTVNNNSFHKSKKKLANSLYRNQHYLLLQFFQLPSPELKQKLEATGIRFHHYIPHNAYLSVVPAAALDNELLTRHVRSFYVLKEQDKISKKLTADNPPSWIVKKPGYLDVTLGIIGQLPFSDLDEELRNERIEILKKTERFSNIQVRIKKEQLFKLARKSWIAWIEPVEPPLEVKNIKGKTLHRSNVLNADFLGARHLTGKGVNIGVWDNTVKEHYDLHDRVTVLEGRENVINAHGLHVSGTLAGNGLLNPDAMGMAPEANLFTWNFNIGANDLSVEEEMALSVNEHDIVITQNSYGPNPYPDEYFDYTQSSQALDMLVNEYPFLVHVFAAGNEQQDRQIPYGSTVVSSKNTIAVGAVDDFGDMSEFSSWGPVHDGRLKPDVCALGVNVLSTVFNNRFESQDWTGTSMACPGVSGTVAQLIQRYRQLHNNQNPPASLMKAVICNSATDILNPGPDYKSGFGNINGLKAIEILENEQFVNSSVNNDKENIHSIQVPDDVKELKVMLVWSDKEGIPLSSKALVNVLTLSVDDGSQNYLPWILNPDYPWKTAKKGVDHTNNIQQVSIKNPTEGKMDIIIKGEEVPFGPQNYTVVYRFVKPSVTVTYPFGEEKFSPGDIEILRWDSEGAEDDQILEYSVNNGGSWKTIKNDIPAGQHYYEWTVPDVVTGQALIRVKQGNYSDVSDKPFTIMGIVEDFTPIPGYDNVTLTWPKIPGASQYDVYSFDQGEITLETTIADTFHTFSELSRFREYYYAVRAKNTNVTGGRSAATIQKTVPRKDVGVVSVEYPVSGCLMPDNVSISIKYATWGADPLPAGRKIEVRYTIGGKDTVTENITIQQQIQYGDTAEYTFDTKEDFSAVDSIYRITCWSELPDDGKPENDKASHIFIHYPVVSEFPYKEDFDTFNPENVLNDDHIYLQDGWTNDFKNDDTDWYIQSGATHSEGTGPVSDHTDGYGKYLYVEASELDYAVKDVYLESPCFDLSELEIPQLTFWYHMYAKDSVMGNLHLDVFSYQAEQWTEDVIKPFSGNQGNQWWPYHVNLSDFSGHIKIRFRAKTAGNFQNDIAIDDVSLHEMYENDISIVDLPSPSPGKLLSDNEILTVALKNIGIDTIQQGSVLSFTLQIDDENDITEELTLKDDFPPDSTLEYRFENGINMSDLSRRYKLSCMVNFPEDDNKENDTYTKYVQTYCEPTSSYEDQAGIREFRFHGLHTDSRRTNTTTGGYSFYGEKTTHLHKGGTYPYYARSLEVPVYYALWIDFDQDGTFSSENECVYEKHWGRVSDVENAVTVPKSAKNGKTRLRIRTSYLKEDVDPATPCNHHRLGETEDYTVIIEDELDYDVSIVSLISPLTESSEYSDYEDVEVSIGNFGEKDIPDGDSIFLGYSLDNKEVITETFITKNTFSSQDTITYMFNEGVDLLGGGKHELKVWLHYSKDQDPVNDTAVFTLTNTRFTDWVLQNTGFGPSTGVDYISIIDESWVWATSRNGETGEAGNRYTRTTYGGKYWWPGVISDKNYLHASMIHGITDKIAWVPMYSGDQRHKGGLYYTTNSGGSWTRVDNLFDDRTSFVNLVYFWNDQEGFCQGDPIDGYFEIYTTEDGGENWSRVSNSQIPAPLEEETGYVGLFDVDDEGVVWFGTNQGRIFKSSNKGKNWTAYKTPLDDITQLAFSDSKNGLASEYLPDRGYITYITDDGGITWSRLNEDGDIFPGSYCYIPNSKNTFVSAGMYQSDFFSGISYSIDHGKTWEYFYGQLYQDQYLNVEFLHAGNGYAGAYNSLTKPVEGGIWKYIGPPLGTTVFKSFEIEGQITDAAINPGPFEIHTAVSKETPRDELIAYFELSDKATAKVNGHVQITGESMNDFTDPVVYTIEDLDGNKQKWTVYVYQYTVGIDSPGEDRKITIFPNPAQDKLFIDGFNSGQLEIYDIFGRKVFEKDIVSFSGSVSLQEIPAGAYILRISEDRKVETLRFVVVR